MDALPFNWTFKFCDKGVTGWWDTSQNSSHVEFFPENFDG